VATVGVTVGVGVEVGVGVRVGVNVGVGVKVGVVVAVGVGVLVTVGVDVGVPNIRCSAVAKVPPVVRTAASPMTNSKAAPLARWLLDAPLNIP